MENIDWAAEYPEMPCGSTINCLECRHFVMVTETCSYMERLTEEEYDEFVKKLYQLPVKSMQR